MLAFLLALVSSIAIPPKPAKYVTDNAHVLDAARASALNEKLAQFDRDTSNQVLVYVDRKLPADTTIEQLGSEAMHQWGVGQKGKDNGAVLFLFIDDRKMRIEVGYGLESSLTDAKSREITSTIIKPRLKANDYDGAVEQGADAMLAVARGEVSKGTGKTAHETKQQRQRAPDFEFVIILLLCIGLPVLIAILLIVFLLRSKRGPRNYSKVRTHNSGSSSSSGSSWSDSSSSSSSSSDSSSSFDGGGGDSGGGGSSDSW